MADVFKFIVSLHSNLNCIEEKRTEMSCCCYYRRRYKLMHGIDSQRHHGDLQVLSLPQDVRPLPHFFEYGILFHNNEGYRSNTILKRNEQHALDKNSVI